MAWDTHRRLLAWWIASSLSFKTDSCSERRGTISWPTRHTSTSPTQPERSTQYYRKKEAIIPRYPRFATTQEEDGKLAAALIQDQITAHPFFCHFSYNSLHRRFFFPFSYSTPQRNHQRSHLGVNKAGVLSFLMRAFWITLSCKNPNYNFFPSTRSFAREVLLIALLLSCSLVLMTVMCSLHLAVL